MGQSRTKWLLGTVRIDTGAASKRPSTSSVLCLLALILIDFKVKGCARTGDIKHVYIEFSMFRTTYMYGKISKDTIWPTQVVAMARRERTDPRRLSLRSVTDAMPTPKSKTRREYLIFWLQVQLTISG